MGRKARVGTYISKPLKKTKNISTRRTTEAVIHRDIKKLAGSHTNKRVK